MKWLQPLWHCTRKMEVVGFVITDRRGLRCLRQKRVTVEGRYYIHLKSEEVQVLPRRFRPIQGKHIKHIARRVHCVRCIGIPGRVQVCVPSHSPVEELRSYPNK